jgi:methionine synthase reductase
VPNANLKLTNVESPVSTASTGDIPPFIQTPTKLMSAKINSVQCLTCPDALKRTLSVEFGFDDDVDYAPGDAFGIWAPNDESLVRGVLAAMDVKDEDLTKHYKLEGEGEKHWSAVLKMSCSFAWH